MQINNCPAGSHDNSPGLSGDSRDDPFTAGRGRESSISESRGSILQAGIGAVDGSEIAERALDEAINLTKGTRSR